MEKYIQKIHDRILRKHNDQKVAKIKKKYQIAGGIVLGLGLAGFIGFFVAFIITFLGGGTDAAMTYWIAAIPFLVLVVSGAVVARVGDALPKSENGISQTGKETKEENTEK